MKKLANFFYKPKATPHRQYEAIRSVIVGKEQSVDVAKRYGYSVGTLYSLIRDFKSGKLSFFKTKQLGPMERRMPVHLRQMVINYRKENLSAKDIKVHLEKAGYQCSTRTVERILIDANLPRLQRRTFAELGKTLKNAIIPERSAPLDFDELKPFHYDCPVAGIFFFLPYLIESGILDIVKQSRLPKSSDISAEQACLSMLLLKLIGSQRLSHIDTYDHEPGLGVFAGLNFLPKKSFMNTYSCRTSDELLQSFQQQLMTIFQKNYPSFYQSNFINLDFHSIPHFGEESKMQKVWCGARGKAIKGANTIFAQDSESNAILYTCADILRKNEPEEIKKFVTYWKAIKKEVNETLVFDCKLTTYGVLDDLAKDGIKFITLRKRTQALITKTEKIPENEWQKMYLPIPKRKHKSCMIHVSNIILPKCKSPVKQIIITNHGRAQPTYVVTNNTDLTTKDILIVYAKRWHIGKRPTNDTYLNLSI